MKSFNVIEVMKFWKFMKSFCGSFLTSYKDSYLQKPFGPYKEAPFKLLMLLHQMNFFFTQSGNQILKMTPFGLQICIITSDCVRYHQVGKFPDKEFFV